MKTFLVTGGCGFIGSHLSEALVRAGHGVRILDDLSSGSRSNIPPGADFIEGDVADAAAVRRVLQGVDGCFHLAAIASVERGVQDWLGTHRVNLTGTITVFDEVRRLGRAGAIPVVYASSAAVYGDCDILPITETTARRPLSAYGADKYGCELHALVATHTHAIPTLGLRFFNVYGPRQDPRSPYSGVISIFCERLRRNASVDIFGDGGQTRDFIYVGDVVAALLAGMAQPPPGGRVLNVCTGVETSVRDLASVIADLCQTTPQVREQPPRAGEVRHSVGSRTLAEAVLALSPPTPLRVGLGNVLTWMQAG